MIIRLLAILLMLTPTSVASAAEMTLDYQAVMHVTKAQAASVLDDKKHLIGVGAFSGIAIFADKEVVRHRYDGWFDLNEGSGPFHGYALWTFNDGSTLRARYDGSVQMTADDNAEVSANLHDVTGTGRFKNATGKGSFAGRRFESIQQGGSTYLKGSLTLTMPD